MADGDAPKPRAFRRGGLLRRAAPFAIATLGGLVLLVGLGAAADRRLLVLALSGFAVLCGLVVVVPWERLPRWTDVVPPLLLLGLIAFVEVDETIGEALRRADERLYEAKRGGRDRIVE